MDYWNIGLLLAKLQNNELLAKQQKINVSEESFVAPEQTKPETSAEKLIRNMQFQELSPADLKMNCLKNIDRAAYIKEVLSLPKTLPELFFYLKNPENAKIQNELLLKSHLSDEKMQKNTSLTNTLMQLPDTVMKDPVMQQFIQQLIKEENPNQNQNLEAEQNHENNQNNNENSENKNNAREQNLNNSETVIQRNSTQDANFKNTIQNTQAQNQGVNQGVNPQNNNTEQWITSKQTNFNSNENNTVNQNSAGTQNQPQVTEQPKSQPQQVQTQPQINQVQQQTQTVQVQSQAVEIQPTQQQNQMQPQPAQTTQNVQTDILSQNQQSQVQTQTQINQPQPQVQPQPQQQIQQQAQTAQIQPQQTETQIPQQVNQIQSQPVQTTQNVQTDILSQNPQTQVQTQSQTQINQPQQQVQPQPQQQIQQQAQTVQIQSQLPETQTPQQPQIQNQIIQNQHPLQQQVSQQIPQIQPNVLPQQQVPVSHIPQQNVPVQPAQPQIQPQIQGQMPVQPQIQPYPQVVDNRIMPNNPAVNPQNNPQPAGNLPVINENFNPQNPINQFNLLPSNYQQMMANFPDKPIIEYDISMPRTIPAESGKPTGMAAPITDSTMKDIQQFILNNMNMNAQQVTAINAANSIENKDAMELFLSGLINIHDVGNLLKTNGKHAASAIVLAMAAASKKGLDTSQLQDTLKFINASVSTAAQESPAQTLKSLMMLYLPWLPLNSGVGFDLEIETSPGDDNKTLSVLTVLIQTLNYGNLKGLFSLTTSNSVNIHIICSDKFPKDELMEKLNAETKIYSMQSNIEFEEQKPLKDEEKENREAKVNLSATDELNPYLLLMAHSFIRNTILLDNIAGLNTEKTAD